MPWKSTYHSGSASPEVTVWTGYNGHEKATRWGWSARRWSANVPKVCIAGFRDAGEADALSLDSPSCWARYAGRGIRPRVLGERQRASLALRPLGQTTPRNCLR